MAKRLFAALLAPLLIGATERPAPVKRVEIASGPLAAKVDAILTDYAAKGFDGMVIVEDKGRIVLKAGYGWADREAKVPFTAETRAQIGSITKPLTAIAILQLAEAGKVDLSKPVKAYVPDAAEPAASATLHQLLTHHAGLMDACGDDFDRLTREDLLHRCMAQPLKFPTSEDHYSNMGFSILAAVVERVSGQPWENYLKAHEFKPFGMAGAGFAYPDGQRGVFANGYLNDERQEVISARIRALGGADWNLRGNGGAQASAVDMDGLFRALSGHAPGLSRALVERMSAPREAISGNAYEGYGMAVRLDKDGKVFRVGHSGSDGVFFSYFGWFPKEDLFVYVVGSNGEKEVKPAVGAVVGAVQAAAGESGQGG
jgi:CubicO group peptidase (beta-lactamase class C family)